jgi:ferredoxin
MQTMIYVAVPIAMILVAIVIYKRVAPGDEASTAGEPGAGTEAIGNLAARPAGLLHPVVDLATCMGSGGCVSACPERALGLVRGRAVLLNSGRCLSHGVCGPACPVGAISFVPGAA